MTSIDATRIDAPGRDYHECNFQALGHPRKLFVLHGLSPVQLVLQTFMGKVIGSLRSSPLILCDMPDPASFLAFIYFPFADVSALSRVNLPESLSMTQRSPPALPPPELLELLDESSLDDSEDESSLSAAQNLDMVPVPLFSLSLLPTLITGLALSLLWLLCSARPCCLAALAAHPPARSPRRPALLFELDSQCG